MVERRSFPFRMAYIQVLCQINFQGVNLSRFCSLLMSMKFFCANSLTLTWHLLRKHVTRWTSEFPHIYTEICLGFHPWKGWCFYRRCRHIPSKKIHKTRWWFQIFFYVQPYFGKMGWNHQPGWCFTGDVAILPPAKKKNPHTKHLPGELTWPLLLLGCGDGKLRDQCNG